MKDAINRRLRWAPPQPTGERFELNDRDYELLRFLGRHGKLHTLYLHEATKHIAKDFTRLTHRLGQLYNGYCEHRDHHSPNKDGHDCKPVRHITRDPKQFDHFNARYLPIVHELIKPNTRYHIGRSGSFVHDFFTSCFTASAELLGRGRFVFRDTIIDHADCPQATRESETPFTIPHEKHNIEPDDIFGLQFGDLRRFFLLETDCASERVRMLNYNPDKKLPSAIENKIRGYVAVMRSGMRAHFGFNRPYILFATSAVGRVASIADAFQDPELVPPNLRRYFHVKAFPQFTRKSWTIPDKLLDVYTGWKNGDGETVDINTKAP